MVLDEKELQYQAFRAVRHIINSYDGVLGPKPQHNDDIAGAIRGIFELERLLSIELEYNKNEN